MQREYELVLVINPEISDERLPDVVERYNQMIATQGGSVTATNPWGRRRLAYPIRKFLEGHYIHTQFTIEPKATAALESNLRLSEDVLRHLVVRLGD